MSKFKWFDLEDLSFAEFARLRDGIESQELKRNSTSGFKIESSNSKQIIARFIKRFEYTEKVQDPFGGAFEIPVFGYDEVDFRLYNSSPRLETTGGSSDAINLLTTQLISMLSRAPAISEAAVEPVKWLSFLTPNFENFEVTLMSLSDVPITNSISAKVVISGVEDVRGGIPKLIGNRQHSVQKLRLEARFSGELFKIELYANGKATFTPDDRRMERFLRNSLVKARGQNQQQV